MKRILLFLATNLAVLIVLSTVVKLLGLDQMLARGGLGLDGLLIMAAVIGMGGAFISLAMSKWMAKMTTGAQLIESPRTATEKWLVETVRRHAEKAGIGMPDVAVYNAPDMNAFATGMSRNHALVAVSTGLIDHMRREEVEAVLGHEIAHVANGDMVTLTLIQGVVNTFVIFFARIVGMLVDNLLRRGDSEQSGPGIGYWVASIAAEIVFGILASTIVMWFSRQREFRADAGGAQFAGTGNMISALERLQAGHGAPLPDQMAAFGINGGIGEGLRRLFMSHPPIEERIAALRARG